jgi:hypothetical protein
MAYINQRILPLNINLPLVVQSLAAAVCAYILASFVHTPYAAATLALRLPFSLLAFVTVLLLLSRYARQAATGLLRRSRQRDDGPILADVEEASFDDATLI